MNFKVGDKVRSIRPKTEEEREQHPVWIPEMDDSLNHIGIIKYINIKNKEYSVLFGEKKYNYHRNWLKPAKKNIG